MRKITTEEFYTMIESDPSVFEHWNTPLEITQYVDCENSEITHLSKHLTFTGRNSIGNVACFLNCPDLKTACGTFQGFVSFRNSGVEKIENLHITQPNIAGRSVNFWNCKSLQIATGTYPGFASFRDSGIHTIHNLQIQNPNQNGYYADFNNCPNLHTLEGWNITKGIMIEPEKHDAEINRRDSLKTFVGQSQPQPLPFL